MCLPGPFVVVAQTPVPCQYWVDSSAVMLPVAVVATARFGPPPAGLIKARGSQPTVWLRFQLRNGSTTDTLRRLFFGGYHGAWSLTEQAGPGAPLQTRRSGWLVRPGPRPGPDAFTLPLVVPPGQTLTGWFQTTGYLTYSNITPRLYTPASYTRFGQERMWRLRGHTAFYFLLVGICLFLSLFSLVQWLYAHDATYGFWSLYLAATGLFIFLLADLAFNLQWVGPTLAALTLSSQYVIATGYVLFLRSFLQIAPHMPRLNRGISWLAGVLLGMAALSFWSGLYLVEPVYKFTDQAILYTELTLLAIMVGVSVARVPNRTLFIIGSLGLIALAGVGTVINEFGPADGEYFWTDPVAWFGLGVGFELLFFNLALSQRASRTVREKQQLEYDKQLDDQRIEQITEQFRQRTAHIEMAALRAQMNPHFIFNCLNSIQFFTAQNDAARASDYLTKFSRLIRLVLENSQSERVTLANELDTLRLYMEMEAMRFRDKVSYCIEVEPGLSAEDIQLPPLLIQPYVENAIWHGLMHREAGGQVRIGVSQPGAGLLRVVIADDGVGRAKAGEYKSKSATKSKSFGLKLTAERIELINQLYQSHTQVRVEDLVDEQGRAAGTRVVVEIPV